MLYRVLMLLLTAAFILTSCDDDGDGFHKAPERGYITIYGAHSGASNSCGGEHYGFADYFGVYVKDSAGHPLSEILVSVTTDEFLILLDSSDSASYTNDSGYVEVEIGSQYFGDGFWFQVVAAGDTEVFDLSIREQLGTINAHLESESDTLINDPLAPDSMMIVATLRWYYGEPMPGSIVRYGANVGQIDTSAHIFESNTDTIYWFPTEFAQTDDVFVYASFDYWCHYLRDSLLVESILRDTTSFIVIRAR